MWPTVAINHVHLNCESDENSKPHRHITRICIFFTTCQRNSVRSECLPLFMLTTYASFICTRILNLQSPHTACAGDRKRTRYLHILHSRIQAYLNEKEIQVLVSATSTTAI